MLKYRARVCPNCNYFVGFTAPKALAQHGTAALTNFCLNCNYKLPVHTIVRGNGTARRILRQAKLRVVSCAHESLGLISMEHHRNSLVDTRISPADYARHLRAIGQDLENLHLSTFNLEYVGDAYLVWVRPEQQPDTTPHFRINQTRLLKLWRDKIPSQPLGHEESYARSDSQIGRRLRYSVQELDRIEREQRARRRQPTGSADGHRLSQLLRTVGDLVSQRGERLLGIAWQELSISVVVETARGRKEIDVFRPDNLYDLWVRMYLKRNHHAFVDTH